MDKLRVAMVGLGHQAEEDHIPGIMESEFAKLVAICDPDEERLLIWKNKLNLPAYKDYKELLHNEKLDFVIIATPHDSHLEIVNEAAKNGVHILKEKPLAKCLAEAKVIKDVCNQNKIYLSVTLQRRFNPIYSTFFQLIDKIGDISYIEMKYCLFSSEPHNGWRGCKNKCGGGCILDMGYHMVDMLIWYFGLPDRVFADFSSVRNGEESVEVEDNATIGFSFNNSISGSIILSRYYSPKTEYIKVIGSKGILFVERGKISRLKSNGEVIEALTRENAWSTAASNQIDYFCKVVEGQRENISGPEMHLKHMSFIEACYLSRKKGEFINPHNFLEEDGNK